jgi:hypothetical protein
MPDANLFVPSVPSMGLYPVPAQHRQTGSSCGSLRHLDNEADGPVLIDQ